MKLSLKDLLTGKDGRISHVKLWANVASLTATGVVIWYAWRGSLTWDMFGLYLATVGGYYTVGKYLDLKHGTPSSPQAQAPEEK